MIAESPCGAARNAWFGHRTDIVKSPEGKCNRGIKQSNNIKETGLRCLRADSTQPVSSSIKPT